MGNQLANPGLVTFLKNKYDQSRGKEKSFLRLSKRHIADSIDDIAEEKGFSRLDEKKSMIHFFHHPFSEKVGDLFIAKGPEAAYFSGVCDAPKAVSNVLEYDVSKWHNVYSAAAGLAMATGFAAALFPWYKDPLSLFLGLLGYEMLCVGLGCRAHLSSYDNFKYVAKKVDTRLGVESVYFGLDAFRALAPEYFSESALKE